MDEIVKDDIKVTVVNTATSDEEKKASSSSSEEAKDSKVDNDDQKEEKKLYKKEDRAKGVVGCGTYLAWFRSASSFGYGIPWALFIVTLYLTAQVGRTGSDFLLTYWAKTPNEPALILYISLTCVTFVLLMRARPPSAPLLST